MICFAQTISHSEILQVEEFMTDAENPFCATLYLTHSWPFLSLSIYLSNALMLHIDFHLFSYTYKMLACPCASSFSEHIWTNTVLIWRVA